MKSFHTFHLGLVPRLKNLFFFGDFHCFSSTTNCQCSIWPEAVEEKGKTEEPKQGVLSQTDPFN